MYIYKLCVQGFRRIIDERSFRFINNDFFSSSDPFGWISKLPNGEGEGEGGVERGALRILSRSINYLELLDTIFSGLLLIKMLFTSDFILCHLCTYVNRYNEYRYNIRNE